MPAPIHASNVMLLDPQVWGADADPRRGSTTTARRSGSRQERRAGPDAVQAQLGMSRHARTKGRRQTVEVDDAVTKRHEKVAATQERRGK